MNGHACSLALALAALAATWGCAGDGTGLDEFGSPLGGGQQWPNPFAPTLSAIQANIFTPICTQCHTGASAPQGLALDAGVARPDLVGVRSAELPALMRVSPGKPDSSYLVWKIEGRSGIVGAQMPLGLPPLSGNQIAAVRGWILAGALQN